MPIITQEMLWRQFGAAIDMLGDALQECPDDLWEARLENLLAGCHKQKQSHNDLGMKTISQDYIFYAYDNPFLDAAKGNQ